jgi:hypothetical protein
MSVTAHRLLGRAGEGGTSTSLVVASWADYSLAVMTQSLASAFRGVDALHNTECS